MPSIQADALPAFTTRPWAPAALAQDSVSSPPASRSTPRGAVAAVMIEQDWFLAPVALTGYEVYEWEGFRQQSHEVSAGQSAGPRTPATWWSCSSGDRRLTDLTSALGAVCFPRTNEVTSLNLGCSLVFSSSVSRLETALSVDLLVVVGPCCCRVVPGFHPKKIAGWRVTVIFLALRSLIKPQKLNPP